MTRPRQIFTAAELAFHTRREGNDPDSEVGRGVTFMFNRGELVAWLDPLGLLTLALAEDLLPEFKN